MKNELSQKTRDAMDAYGNILLRYSYHIVRNDAMARDAVQETFIQLTGNPPDEWKEPLLPWLLKVCRSRSVDLQRKEIAMQNRHDKYKDLESGEPTIPNLVTEQNDNCSQLLSYLNKLPEKQQEVLRLKYQNSLSYKEIAAITGETVSNVGYLVHHGIRALRHEFATNL